MQYLIILIWLMQTLTLIDHCLSTLENFPRTGWSRRPWCISLRIHFGRLLLILSINKTSIAYIFAYINQDSSWSSRITFAFFPRPFNWLFGKNVVHWHNSLLNHFTFHLHLQFFCFDGFFFGKTLRYLVTDHNINFDGKVNCLIHIFGQTETLRKSLRK